MAKMMKDKGYRSEIAGAVHEMMSGAHDAGVMTGATLRSFDAACLAPAPMLAGAEIRALREREHVSQTVFAMHLNVSKDSVSQWERGDKRPAGPAVKLLSIVAAKGLAAIA